MHEEIVVSSSKQYTSVTPPPQIFEYLGMMTNLYIATCTTIAILCSLAGLTGTLTIVALQDVPVYVLLVQYGIYCDSYVNVLQ